jgi:hypothetical protein
MFVFLILPSIAIFSEIYYLQTTLNYPFYLRYFQVFAVIIVVTYGSLSYSRTTKLYDKKGWLEDLIAEHEFLKKLLYVSLPMLILVTFVFVRTYQPEQQNFSYALLAGMIFIVGGALLRYTSNTTKKNFRFYYAKGCIQLLSKKTDKSEKMNLLVRALNSYNKYLKKTLKLQINNIDKICSKIISDPFLDKHEFTKSISDAFQSDDKLKPTTQILSFLNIKNTEEFLIKEPLWTKIEEWGTLLVPIITVAISIIQFVLPIFLHSP